MESISLYKQLYHASVERCGILQEKVEKYSDLLSKHKKITELKNEALSSLSKNEEALNTYYRTLVEKEEAQKEQLQNCFTREEELKEKLESCLSREEKLQQEHEELLRDYKAQKAECAELRQTCATYIVRTALARAGSKEKDWKMEEMKSRNTTEGEKIKKLSKYSQSLRRKYNEIKESVEFSEAERSSLMESNAEMETQLHTLRTQLEEKNLALEETKSQLKAKSTPPPPPVFLSESFTTSCPTCTELGKQLAIATAALNNRGCAKYGDLLHSNFLKEQQLKSMKSKLAEGVQMYQSLTDYIQEYKARSVEKVDILKENIRKADEEIAELDKLIDIVREALHNSLDLVQQSPHLMKALKEIEGTNHVL